ncbi:hypothetical protein ACZ87_02019, partial [Candidatus Erwinia dacicola]
HHPSKFTPRPKTLPPLNARACPALLFPARKLRGQVRQALA